MILSSGSGLIINHTGVIVTNAHVVNIAATVPWRTELRVQLQNSDVYVGMVRDVDWKTDIATVKVNPQVGAPYVSQTDSSVHVRDESHSELHGTVQMMTAVQVSGEKSFQLPQAVRLQDSRINPKPISRPRASKTDEPPLRLPAGQAPCAVSGPVG